MTAGASPTRIKQSLERFRAWLPLADVSLSQLSLVQRSGQILMRLNETLVEPSGQMHFDFDAGVEDETGVLSFLASVETPTAQFDLLFDQGLAFEDQRRFAQAADAYRQARDLSPDDPAVHFNLGNVLYELGEYGLSMDSYRQALSCDPQYAEAWNNLGFVLWRTGQLPDAVQAFRRALALVPDYTDARHNLQSVQEELASLTFPIVS